VFRGVEHVGLYPYAGADAHELAEWYQRMFGLELKEGNSSIFVAGSSPGRIEVMKKAETDRCHVAILVSDFETAVEAIKAKGVELGEPQIKPNVKAAYLKETDPAGNRVHLLWRGQ